ncbi:MAG: helix-turn-helix domain-containing protein [Candidatus Dormibacteria bacterium]
MRYHVQDSALLSDRVLPDACVDLIWDGLTLFVAGPDSGPVPLVPPPSGFFAGVRFRTGRARFFLGVPAWELLDQRVELAELRGSQRSANLIEVLKAASSPVKSARVLECAVLADRSPAAIPDPTVDALVAQLQTRGDSYPQSGSGPVARISRLLGVSERELLRRCRDAVGYGPKKLDRILRFQRSRARAATAVSLADLAADSGYADQAHMTRECRRLSGLTPSELFKPAARSRS